MYPGFNSMTSQKSFDFQQFTPFLLKKQATIRQEKSSAPDALSVACGFNETFCLVMCL